YLHFGKPELLHHELIILPEFVDRIAAVSLHFKPARQSQSIPGFFAELKRAGEAFEKSKPVFDEAKRTARRNQDQKQRPEQQMDKLPVKPERCECQQQTKAGNCVEHQHGALPRQPKIDEPMVDVLSVGAKKRQPFQAATKQSQTDIENRQSK